MNIFLKPVLGEHAKLLFPLVTSNITQTIQWDGPSSFEDYETGLTEREQLHKSKKIHMFSIFNVKTNKPIGSIDIRPDSNMFRADIGLWVGEEFHGKGAGTQSVKEITTYGFNKLALKKIEASVFLGNMASRKIFEKNNYKLEGTIRSACLKKNKAIDEWILGITEADYLL